MDVHEIRLPCGKTAIVDAAMLPTVSQHRWTSHVGSKSGVIYARAIIDSRYVTMHRTVFGFIESGYVIDHIDRNGLNNCMSNLRKATLSGNSANRIKQQGKYSSIYKGVHLRPEIIGGKCWRAVIECNKKRISIGSFYTEEEAAIAYDVKAIEMFGEFARLNFHN